MSRIFLIFILCVLQVTGELYATDTTAVGKPARTVLKLAKAIRYKTISAVDPKKTNYSEFAKLHRCLQLSFPRVSDELQREVIGHSLLYTWKGSNPQLKPILLSGHMDVVPVEQASAEAWEHPPFEGIVEGGYIWGRGTMDDKYRVVAMLEAVERLLEEGYKPDRTILLAFGHDEEVGGYEGAGDMSKHLANKGISLEAVFDEGLAVAENILPGVDQPIALIGTAAKGNINLKLTVVGPGGHSSVPPDETPIGILSQAIYKLQQQPFEPRLTPTTRETLEKLAPLLGAKYEFAMQHYGLFKGRVLKALSRDQATDALIRTKMAPTIINAGDKFNVLPREASAIINIRILNGENEETVLGHVRSAIGDERVRIERYGVYTPPSAVTPTNSALYGALEKTILEVYPEVVAAPALFPGATDSRHYANLTENIFRFAPQVVTREKAQLVHNVNERLAVDMLENCVLFYKLLLKNTCGVGSGGFLVEENSATLPKLIPVD
ncbi:M20/M25/M40 family metallo-hydrolase [Pontibacter oryzae]|uniref:M20/M25/M40 family metallo-hydrolase n=1 Tax=Pontibacter oryzae TaxID=2304593 RepID=A0A399SFF7_9BACT|nr:M20/M25/M40 family metallo-hydrolase [Pontibacter oryzae]RIJ41549.1 M20/M25/M40 family metallo-hydrolase [Pontibacter oryzae]